MDRLIKALQVYMYDQYNCPDVHEHDDESLVDDIIHALIEKNENRCPYREKCKEYNKLIYSEYELVRGEADEKKPTD